MTSADEFLKRFSAFLNAESEAFEKAGKETEMVTFTCPLCGGQATSSRFETGDRAGGCAQCGFSYAT